VYAAPVRYRHTHSRSHWFRAMRDRFEPLEPISLDERQGDRHAPYVPLSTVNAFDDLVLPDLDVSSPQPPSRIRRRQSSHNLAPIAGGPVANPRPIRFSRDPLEGLNGDHVSPVSDIAVEDRSNGITAEDVNDPESRSAAPGRPSGGHTITGSIWAGLFDETDPEHDGSSPHATIHDRAFNHVPRSSMDSTRTGSPRRPTSIFDDEVLDGVPSRPANDRNSPPQRPASVYDVFRGNSWRRPADSERDAAPRPQTSVDMFRDDLRRRSSVWGSPGRSPGLLDNDHYPPTTSSSSSSLASLDRPTSRSLLDPSLRFGAGPTVNPRSSLSWASEQDSALARLRRRSRTTIHGLFDEGHIDGDHDHPGLQSPAPGDEPRSGDMPMPFSSIFPSPESLGRGQFMSLISQLRLNVFAAM